MNTDQVKALIATLEDCKSYLVACRKYPINELGAIDAQIEDTQTAIDTAKRAIGEPVFL